MKYILFLFYMSLCVGLSDDLDSLIQLSYENNFALKAMQKDVNINIESVKSADSWANPILSVGMSDLLLNDISDRSIEPMQTQFISLSQIIPISGKKQISKEISQNFVHILKLQIEENKRILSSKITLLAYKSQIISKRLSLLTQKKKNLYKMKKLLRAYQKDQEELLDIDIKILTLKNREQKLHYQQDVIKEKIEKFTVVPFSNIKLALLIFNDKPKTNILNHTKIAIFKQNIILQQQKIRLAISKKRADLKVNGGYYQRDSRDDYVNISFSMPLNIRGTEEIEVVKSQLAFKRSQENLKELKNSFEKDIAVLNKKLKTSTQNYLSYTKRLIPKQNKIIQLLKTKNRIGKTNLLEILNAFNKEIVLKELSFDELEHYFEAYASLRYYQ